MIREALVLPRFLARITDFSAKTNAREGFGPPGERKNDRGLRTQRIVPYYVSTIRR